MPFPSREGVLLISLISLKGKMRMDAFDDYDGQLKWDYKKEFFYIIHLIQ